MVKATLKSAVLLFLVAIGMVATSVPSFAETQNVTVGGDITVRGFHRENMDLNEDTGGTTQLDDNDNFIQQTVGINVGADLTENVSTFIRLANESHWGALSAATAAGDFDVSQAHLTLKDAFYSPADVTIGRQPLMWGRGFVLGSNLIPGVFGTSDRNDSIAADEFTDFTAFDAIRVKADLSGSAAVDLPMTVDVIWAKQAERTVGRSDDENLFGVNLGTKLDAANSEVETYYLLKRDRRPGGAEADSSAVNTIGLRGSSQPVDGAYFFGEVAYQFGTRDTDFAGVGGTLPTSDRQQAWAMNFGGEYTLTDVAMTPKVGAEWVWYSGKDIDGGDQGWDPIARGYFTSVIREFQPFYGTTQTGDTPSATNQHQFSLYGGLSPIEDLRVDQRYSWFLQDVAAIQASGGQNERNRYAGFEWDTIATYNYTEDVQLGLIYALFLPGDVYQDPNDRTAQELISSVSVKF